MSPPRVLTIAGSDPSGGAGLQADLKTFHAFGCYGMAVVTALTAQNTLGVSAIHAPPADFVDAQIAALVDDCPPVATKTGMLFSRAIIQVVARWAERGALGLLVVDPVMIATSGHRLLQADAEAALRDLLLPHAVLATPNRPEALALLPGSPADCETDALARRLASALGVATLVKGGHGGGAELRDVLVWPGGASGSAAVRQELSQAFTHRRVELGEAHGTGCTLSAAIAAGLASGAPLAAAIEAAGAFVQRGLRAAFPVGAGAIPVNHLAASSGELL